jgi:hypothetical protein
MRTAINLDFQPSRGWFTLDFCGKHKILINPPLLDLKLYKNDAKGHVMNWAEKLLR